MKTIDLALILDELAKRGPASGPARRTVAVPGFDVEVAHLHPGERWEGVPRVPEALLVLGGIGTITVDDWRASLGGGHTVGLPAGAKVVALADGERTLSFVVFRSEPDEADMTDGESE